MTSFYPSLDATVFAASTSLPAYMADISTLEWPTRSSGRLKAHFAGEVQACRMP